MVDAGGEPAWVELVERIAAARAELGEHTSTTAAIVLLTALHTLHRMDRIGFRGLIGAQEAIAERTTELLGWPRGFGARTCRGAGRILEAADLVERWVHGRGRQVEVPQNPPAADGTPPRRCRRPVVAYTLTAVAASYWSGPRRRVHRTANVGAEPTSANGADNTIGQGRGATLPRDARPSISSARCSAGLLYAVSAVPADDVGGASGAGQAGEGVRASAVPHRMVPWRPAPASLNDWGTATSALLYDLETTLLHHRRPDRPRLLGLAQAELDPTRRLSGVIGAGPPPRGSGLPWDDWVWRWRGMPLQARRDACERALLPALVGQLHRFDLWQIPGQIGARSRLPRPREPGPRAVPEHNQAPPASVLGAGRAPPRASPRWARAPAPPEPLPDWLLELQRRHGGEEV